MIQSDWKGGVSPHKSKLNEILCGPPLIRQAAIFSPAGHYTAVKNDDDLKKKIRNPDRRKLPRGRSRTDRQTDGRTDEQKQNSRGGSTKGGYPTLVMHIKI
jgi:hypothetical protein